MEVCNGWENFKREIFENRKSVVCFGAGMLGLYIENLFIREGIWEKIDCFLDNNLQKEGTVIGEKIPKPILSLNTFLQKKQTEFVLLITCVTFVPIIEQLQQLAAWQEISCYIYPKLNYEIVMKSRKNISSISTTIFPIEKSTKIPKKIHYFWFGKSPFGELEHKCLESWKKHCPDYEIIEWNEDNYDFSKNQYMREAYNMRKWAYVTDYARLDVLWKYGGIYFDTDVELIKNIDGLLQHKAFLAYGEWPAVNSGAGIGCIKGDSLIKEMRDNPRSTSAFILEDGTCDITQNCVYETRILEKLGFSYDFQMQILGDDMLILPPHIIATSSILGTHAYVTEETVAIHHNSESWADKKRKEERMFTMKRDKV